MTHEFKLQLKLAVMLAFTRSWLYNRLWNWRWLGLDWLWRLIIVVISISIFVRYYWLLLTNDT
jgi:hypothetical protein